MFYSNLKKTIAATLITAFTITSIPYSDTVVLANSNSMIASSVPSVSGPAIVTSAPPVSGSAVTTSASSISGPAVVTSNPSASGSAISTNTPAVSNSAIHTATVSGSTVTANPASGSGITGPTATPKPLSITVSKKLSLYPKAKKKLKVTVKNNTAKVKKSFRSKKTSIVKVNSKGKLTAKKAGKTNVITTIKIGKKKYTKKTKVTVIDAYIAFTRATTYLYRGQTFQFKVRRHKINEPVTWSVNNSKVASIDKKTGKLRGKSRGSVLVTATCNSLQKSIYVVIR